jgi:hypothetical protein
MSISITYSLINRIQVVKEVVDKQNGSFSLKKSDRMETSSQPLPENLAKITFSQVLCFNFLFP